MPGSHGSSGGDGGGGGGNAIFGQLRRSREKDVRDRRLGIGRYRAGGRGALDQKPCNSEQLAKFLLMIFMICVTIVPLVTMSYNVTYTSWGYGYPTFQVTGLAADADTASVDGMDAALAFDNNIYRVQSTSTVAANQPIFDYYGYQYGGLYRYTEIFGDADKSNSTYSMALTPWSAVCSTTLPSPEFSSSGGAFMDCDRAKTCETAGNTTLMYGVIASALSVMYFFIGLIWCVFYTYDWSVDTFYTLLFLVVCKCVELIYCILFSAGFQSCYEGLDAPIAVLNNIAVFTCDNDPTNVSPNIISMQEAMWIMTIIQLVCLLAFLVMMIRSDHIFEDRSLNCLCCGSFYGRVIPAMKELFITMTANAAYVPYGMQLIDGVYYFHNSDRGKFTGDDISRLDSKCFDSHWNKLSKEEKDAAINYYSPYLDATVQELIHDLNFKDSDVKRHVIAMYKRHGGKEEVEVVMDKETDNVMSNAV